MSNLSKDDIDWALQENRRLTVENESLRNEIDRLRRLLDSKDKKANGTKQV